LAIEYRWAEGRNDRLPGIAAELVGRHLQTTPSKELGSVVESTAQSFAVRVSLGTVRDTAEFESIVALFGREPGGGLLVLPGSFTATNRALIAWLAASNRLPAVYPFRFFVASGGLASYGSDTRDLSRRSASYVDRILKGAKPADLPIQMPTKFELAIKSKDCKGARSHRASHAARSRRRGDRVRPVCSEALLQSLRTVPGTKSPSVLRGTTGMLRKPTFRGKGATAACHVPDPRLVARDF